MESTGIVVGGVTEKYVPLRWKKHKLTKEHFDVFCAEIKRLVDIFQLSGYSLYFQHAPIDSKAAYKISSSMTISYCLATVWEDVDVPTNEQVLVSARHEFAHSMVGMLDIIAHDRFAVQDELTKEFERFAVLMESFLTRLASGEVDYK